MNRLVFCALLLPLINSDSSVAASMLRLEAISSRVEKYELIELAIVPLRLYDNFSPRFYPRQPPESTVLRV